MATPVVFEVLLRPKGSQDEPQVVGSVMVDLDPVTGKVGRVPDPVPPLPSPAEGKKD